MKALLLLLLLIPSQLHATKKPTKVESPNEFVIYDENFNKFYIASGYMGDFGDIKMNTRWDKDPANGKTCIRVEYNALRAQGAGWAGVYWQNPANNWGDKKGGRDLSAYKKLTFKVRGDKGRETIDKFGVGGIAGQTEEGDTDQNSIGPVDLTNKWQDMEIDLKGRDLSMIIGGFLWAANADSNPEGFVFYLDDIKFVK